MKRKSVNYTPPAKRPPKKTLLSPVAQVKEPESDSTLPNWEKSYISSKLTLKTEHTICHYEMVLRAVCMSKDKFSVSQVKICPVSVVVKDKVFDFFLNPIDNIAVCKQKPEIVIPWKSGTFSNPVLSVEELNADEQYNKHLVLLENYIESKFYPEILAVFDRRN